MAKQEGPRSERLNPAEAMYFSLYVSFAEIGAGLWPKRMNDEANNGAFGVAIVRALWLMIGSVVVSDLTHSRVLISKPLWIGAFLLSYALTYLHLIHDRAHRRYDSRFAGLSMREKALHRGLAWGIVCATGAVLALLIHFSRLDLLPA